MTRRASYAAAIFGALVLIGLGYWFATNFARLSSSILPGMQSSPSQSMEPYELVFKLDTSLDNKDGGGANQTPAEWRLTVPRAFLWSEIGSNDDIGGGDDHQLHTASLYATFDPKTENFSPGIFSSNNTNAIEGFFIYPANGGGGKLSRIDQCVRQDDLDAVFDKKAGWFEKCSPNPGVVRCPVSMHHRGWVFRTLMPKKYYFGKYQQYCDAVRAFVDKHTIAIDDLRDLTSD